MSNLTTKAMLVAFSASVWTARKYDKKISKEVTDAHGAVDKAARVNKNLFPFPVPEYQALHTTVGEGRRVHDFETLPWDDKGWRILLGMNHMNYSEKMRALKNKFEGQQPAFFDKYEEFQTASKAALNGMAKDEDFPPLEKLKKKFSFSTSIMPIPDESDFRVSLQLEDLADCRNAIKQEVREKIKQAVREPYHRLYEVVSKMAEKLNDPDANFHKTLVSNVSGITTHVLKALNLEDDEDLKEIGAKIQAGLCEFSPDLLRDNAAIRECVGNRAREVMADLKAFMGGM